MSSNPTASNEPISACPKCGAPIELATRAGVCARCVMSMAMEPTTSTSQSLATEQLVAAFPQYEIEAELGRGGMGAVYRARHRKLDRLVALKVLLPEHDGPDFAERFEREARALAKLDHANIVGVQDIGEADGLYYLVMDYVDGADLRQLLNAGGLSVKDALTWVPQICDALQYAHDQGVVHRDIKPENVLVDQDGQVRIADFGLAKVITAEGADVTLTHAQQGLGTPHYMAPEQIGSAGKVDHRADIYSLGVMLYELLTGELPIGRFEPPSHKSKSTRALDDVVMKTLESDPARRYQSARAVKSGIAGVPERPASAISRYRKELAQKSEPAPRSSDPERPVFPNVAWGSWAAFAIVLAAAFMTWMTIRRGTSHMLLDAWNGTYYGLPMWLQLFVGLAIATIRNLRVRRYEVPRAITLVLSGIGTLFCCGVVASAALDRDASVQPGSLLTMLCMGGWLVVEILEVMEERRPPAPQKPRRRVRRNRARRTPTQRSQD